MQIAVIGSADCSDEEYRVAEAVGRLIADNRGIVCCGGLGGVMEAVCRGAKEAGGTTVGIIRGTGDGNPLPGCSHPYRDGACEKCHRGQLG